MKLLILGGTGATGKVLMNKAIKNNHEVTVLVRSPSKILLEHQKLTVIEGDVLDLEILNKAFKDQDVIVSCLAGDDNNKSDVITRMTQNIIEAMSNNNLKRYISISSAGVHDEFSFLTNLIVKMFYRNAIADHKSAVELIMKSPLDYTVARPLSLTDGPCTQSYRQTSVGVPRGGKNISRCDLADFLLKVAEEQSYIKETVALAY